MARKGEQCSHAKLNDESVRRIREMHVPRKVGAKAIRAALAADGIEVSEMAIKHILYVDNWRHV